MLDHLRKRVARILATADMATLSTTGPAGIQARSFPCEAEGLFLYLLIPGTSDHLLNIELEPQILASTPAWQLRGTAEVLSLAQAPDDLLLTHLPFAPGCVLIRIWPTQLQIYNQNSWGFQETIDIEAGTFP